MSAQDLFDKAEDLRIKEKLVEALEQYKGVLSVASNSILKAESLHMIGLIYSLQENFEAALDYYKKAEELFKELNASDLEAAVLRDQADLLMKEEKLDQAEVNMRQSIQLLTDSGRKGHLGISKVKLGEIFQRKGRLEEAEQSMIDGISDIKVSDDRYFESSAYFSLAKLQQEKNQLVKAKVSAEYALKSLEKIVSEEDYVKRKLEMKLFIENLD